MILINCFSLFNLMLCRTGMIGVGVGERMCICCVLIGGGR